MNEPRSVIRKAFSFLLSAAMLFSLLPTAAFAEETPTDNLAPVSCTCTEKCGEGTVNSACEVCKDGFEKCSSAMSDTAETKPIMSTRSAAPGTAASLGYTTDANKIMYYKNDIEFETDYTDFDIMGCWNNQSIATTMWDPPTYRGYNTFMIIDGKLQRIMAPTVGSVGGKGLKYDREFEFLNDGKLIRIVTTIKNIDKKAHTFSLGTTAEIILENESAASKKAENRMKAFEDKSGFKVVGSSDPNSPQLNFYGKNKEGVTDVDGYWFGLHRDWAYDSNRKEDPTRSSFKTTDATELVDDTERKCISWHWSDRTIEPGAEQVYSVLLGIGGPGSETDAPPTPPASSGIAVGVQEGKLTAGTVGSATFTVTPSGFTDYSPTIEWITTTHDGVEATIANNVVTATSTVAAKAGTYQFKVVSGTTKSDPITLTISAAPDGYITDENELMAYKTVLTNDGYAGFDVRGKWGQNWILVTYKSQGFFTHMIVDEERTQNPLKASETFNEIQYTRELKIINGGKTIQVINTVKNTKATPATISLGTTADIKIGSDDKALLSTFAKGFKMASTLSADEVEGKKPQLNFYGQGTPDVTNVDKYWLGDYKVWNKNPAQYVFVGNPLSELPEFPLANKTDCCAAWNWCNRTIAPGETQTYKVLIGIGAEGGENEGITPSITVGAQSGTPTLGTAGTATFTVTPADFTASEPYSPKIEWITTSHDGVEATIANNVVTATSTVAAKAGTYKFKVVSGTTESAPITLTISKKTASGDMTTLTAKVPAKGKVGMRATLPTLPAGASYGTPTASGTIQMTAMSIAGTTLTYTAPVSGDKQTGTITIPVTGAREYEDYNIVLAATSVAAPDEPTVTKHDTTSITIDTVKGCEYICSTKAIPEVADWTPSYAETATAPTTHTFDKLNPGTKYYIHVRTAAVGGEEASASSATVQHTQSAAPQANAVSIHYMNETIGYPATLEVSSKKENGTPIPNNGKLSDYIPGTVYVRVKAVSGGADASAWTAVTIPTRPENAKTLTIDTVGEKTTVPVGYSYKIGNGSAVDVANKDTDVVVPAEATLTYWKTATENTFASATKPVTAPARLATTNVAIDYEAETVNTTVAMQNNADKTWKICTAGMKLTDLGWVGTAKDVQFRSTATPANYASAAQTLKIPARNTAPTVQGNAETIFGKNDGTITAVTAQMEYQKTGDTAWKTCPNSTVSNLTPGQYKVRTKATKTAFYSLERDITIASGTKLTLTFDGGAYGSTTPATIGDITWQMTLPTLPTSTRTGYTLDGWYNGGTKLTTDTKIEAAITYHAKWTANTYAVTFDANGGTGSIAPQSLVYDTAETALTTSTLTRENYKFAGWNTKKDGSGVSYKNKQSVKNLNDGLAFTLYAQWTENGHYNLSGKITDDTTANVADATVKLIRGKEVIATAMTDNKGDYFISNIRPGVYNMVVTKGERTLTILVTVTDKDVAQNAVLKKAASHSSVLEVTDEPDDPDDPSTPPVKTPDVMVGGLDEVAEDENASILMIVTGEKEDQANNEQQEIKKLEPGSYIQFLDMSITKTENGTQTSIVDTKNNILEVIVPFDFSGKNTVKVLRYHGSAATAFTKLSSKPTSYRDATYYTDEANGFLYVYASKFSTYAVSYTVPSGGGGGDNRYAIDAATAENGTVKLSTTAGYSGNKVTVTVTPNEGYVLKSLTITDSKQNDIAYTDNKNMTYTFTMPNGKVSVKAVFEKIGQAVFTDVSDGYWATDAIAWAYKNGYMNGTSDTTFAPELSTTRGMIATLLWRIENKPQAGQAASFDDLVGGAYYSDAVAWAAEKIIVKGYDADTYGPDDFVTREQLAAILYRYAQEKGMENVNTAENLVSFPDSNKISPYAVPAMNWAVGQGLLSGTTEGNLDPCGCATRAQVAAIFMRYCQNVAK